MTPADILALIPAHYLPWITVLIAVCAAVATKLPPPAPTATGWYPAVYAAVNWVALNFGQARNASAPAAPTNTTTTQGTTP
jgi:hypothetical protein